MAYTLVGTIGVASQGTAGNAVTPAWGTSETRAAGNLLICFCAVTGTVTFPTTPSDWIVGRGVGGTTACSASFFYRIATGSDTAPTIAGITSGVIAAQLAEFSGHSPLSTDTTGAQGGTSSPVTATFVGTDAQSGELMIIAGADARSAARSPNDTWTSNHITTVTQAGNNNGTSSANHYSFGYGTTNSNAAAHTAIMTCSVTTSISGLAVAAATFPLTSTLTIPPDLITEPLTFPSRP